MNAHVQRLIDTAPRLEGQRRLDLTALLLQVRASAVHDDGAARHAGDDARATAGTAA